MKHKNLCLIVQLFQCATGNTFVKLCGNSTQLIMTEEHNNNGHEKRNSNGNVQHAV